MSAGNKRELACPYKNSVTPQMFAEFNAQSKRLSADSCSKWINTSRLVMSAPRNLISESVPGKQAFLFAPSCYLCCPCNDQYVIPERKTAVLPADVWKNSFRIAAWKSVKWSWWGNQHFYSYSACFANCLLVIAAFNHTVFSSSVWASQMKRFYEIQSIKEGKVFHDFNVSYSLPRFLWTTGSVVLCLIFFLCETGMDSRFQWRLLFHCFQGLFLRSRRGFCDECPRQGVFLEHTSKQLLRGSWPHLTTAWFSQGCGVRACVSDSPLAPDKGCHPAPGGGQNHKTGFITMYNVARGSLIRNCPLEYICFPRWISSILWWQKQKQTSKKLRLLPNSNCTNLGELN